MVEMSSLVDKTLNMTIRHDLENSIRHKQLRIVPEFLCVYGHNSPVIETGAVMMVLFGRPSKRRSVPTGSAIA
jgi:hypothetical protein